MTHLTCRLTAKNRDQLLNPTLGNRVWAAFTFTCADNVALPTFAALYTFHIVWPTLLSARQHWISSGHLSVSLLSWCLPTRRYVSAGTSYDPVSVTSRVFCRMDESSWFLASFDSPTLWYKEIWVSPKISVLHSGTLCLQCFEAVGWAAGRASGL